MEFGPDARARTPHQQAYRFAAVAESQHEQSRAAILAALRVTHHRDRKSTRLNSSHSQISYAVFCLKKKKAARPTSKEWTGRIQSLRTASERLLRLLWPKCSQMTRSRTRRRSELYTNAHGYSNAESQ